MKIMYTSPQTFCQEFRSESSFMLSGLVDFEENIIFDEEDGE